MEIISLEQDEQSKMLEQATYTNNYAAFVPWSNSIGFKINSFKYQEQRQTMRIAEDFLASIQLINRLVKMNKTDYSTQTIATGSI